MLPDTDPLAVRQSAPVRPNRFLIAFPLPGAFSGDKWANDGHFSSPPCSPVFPSPPSWIVCDSCVSIWITVPACFTLGHGNASLVDVQPEACGRDRASDKMAHVSADNPPVGAKFDPVQFVPGPVFLCYHTGSVPGKSSLGPLDIANEAAYTITTIALYTTIAL